MTHNGTPPEHAPTGTTPRELRPSTKGETERFLQAVWDERPELRQQAAALPADQQETLAALLDVTRGKTTSQLHFYGRTEGEQFVGYLRSVLWWGNPDIKAAVRLSLEVLDLGAELRGLAERVADRFTHREREVAGNARAQAEL